MSDESLVDLDIGAEADNLYIYSLNRRLLERIKKLIDEAVADPDLLSTAIENAGEGLE